MRHVNVDLVLMIAQGLLPPRMLAVQMVEHLKELCPECGASLGLLGAAHETFVEAHTQRPAASLGDRPDPRYTSLVSKAGRELVEWARRLDEERRAAEADLRTLLRLPRKERRTRIVRARTHFLSRSFAELLIEHAWKIAPSSPEQSAELAGLVPVVLDRIPGVGAAEWVEELRIRGQAHQANALRIAGELPEADRLFLDLRRRLAKAVSNDAELHADAALVSIDLALVYVDQNRTAELRGVSRLIEPILRTRGLHREAMAALILFQQAAAAALVNRESLLNLRLFVEESRRNPRLRFEAPPAWRIS